MSQMNSNERKTQPKKEIRGPLRGEKKPAGADQAESLAARTKHAKAMEIARRSFRRYAETYKTLAK
jgi:hypothetical protein